MPGEFKFVFFVILLISLLGAAFLERFHGNRFYKKVFFSLRDEALLPPQDLGKLGTRLFYLLFAYVIIMVAHSAAGGIIASLLLPVVSGEAVEANVVKTYIFAAGILGTFIASFARLASVTGRTDYSLSIINGLYIQFVITLAGIVLLFYPVAVAIWATPTVIEPMKAAIFSLISEGHALGMVVIMLISAVFSEVFILLPLPD